MRSIALYGVAGTLALSALTFAPPGSAAEGPPHGDRQAEARGTAIAAQRAEAAGVRFGRCAAATRLPAPVRCGTVSVPLDYARPDGELLTLTISRVAATGPAGERQGALVYNPGGPGGSGLYFPLLSVVKAKAYANAARAYDFVGFDPRGVGRSAPISCEAPAEFIKAPTRDPQPTSGLDKQDRIATAKAYAQGCASRSGHLLPYLTTLNSARDLDVIRAALGERKLSYFGASYGTYLGAVYATLFPSHVRRMVFDSVVNPDRSQIWYRANLEQSAAFEIRWADWRDWVARHDAAYHLGHTAEQVRDAYESVRAALAAKPAGGVVGPGELQSAYLGAGYYDGTWQGLAAALSAYVHGDPRPLIARAAPDPAGATGSENGNAVYTAVECADAPWPRDWFTWDRDNTALARTAPFETWDNAWMNLPCAFWPAPHRQPLEVATYGHELPPVLLVSAERDAATPHAGAVELQRRLPGSVLVTERGSGSHGVVYGPNACVNDRVDAYLLRGETGADRTQTCGPHPEPKP
ncbi:alpha/beta hydrolase [Streptomyces sp. H10-C2]|uniref:alpha/beta hydrolase n=1 Tax=unclassified Streptomyces TaxID=2593676 RepID=UPI0024BBB597|nr:MULTISPECIES: alpha/beta hydrolase [unclassified Streptomyces]MDJ0344667.1 alpha/beta hydrolase [Streptomyces sp. PH10-H1]MDJ0372849.1 alpha/beta hydrolase [Streptomyces sp. H10-C2]